MKAKIQIKITYVSVELDALNEVREDLAHKNVVNIDYSMGEPLDPITSSSMELEIPAELKEYINTKLTEILIAKLESQ